MQRSKKILVNAISASRIVAAVIVVAFAVLNLWCWAFWVAVIGFLTDYFDGYYARRWHVVSPFGMFFDPLTDKILCLTIIAVFAFVVSPWYWVIFTIFFLYDATTTTLRLMLANRLKMPAQKIAKIKTATQMVGLMVMLLAMGVPLSLRAGVLAVGTLTLIVATCLTLVSLYRYLRYVALFLTKEWLELSPGVMDIDFKQWHDVYDVRAVLFDIEGTLAEYSQREVSEEMAAVIAGLASIGIDHVGIVTNIRSREAARVEAIARQLGVELYRYPTGLHDRKPHRVMARALLEEMGFDPTHAAFVGDKIVDVLVGARLDMPRVAWVDRLGTADHIVEKHGYRPIEKLLKKFVRPE